MLVISHRGLWTDKSEQNSYEAFKRSFESGFGVETDLRDFQEEIVISHDMADEHSLKFEEFLKLYRSTDSSLVLALNIKSCGLQTKLKELLVLYGVSNYFLFDMAVPDGLASLDHELTVFDRVSEFETQLVYGDRSKGVWVDCFKGEWFSSVTLENLMGDNRRLCLVSPELHGRDHIACWQKLKGIAKSEQIMICTDYPQEAREFFSE